MNDTKDYALRLDGAAFRPSGNCSPGSPTSPTMGSPMSPSAATRSCWTGFWS